jgi:hypothetical protein
MYLAQKYTAWYLVAQYFILFESNNKLKVRPLLEMWVYVSIAHYGREKCINKQESCEIWLCKWNLSYILITVA